MRHHELKTWPEFFEDIVSGAKTFELRNDDRGFNVGDSLELREYDPRTETYTGRSTWRKVKHLLRHEPDKGCAATFGLAPGFVILSLEDGRSR